MMGKTWRWFADSPDVGLPECICSWCGEVIERDQVPVRLTDLERDLEARFHLTCYKISTIQFGLCSGMPAFYRPPFGLPFYWMDEMSGVLRGAVRAFLDSRVMPGNPAVDVDQVAALREYLVHFINAPCFDDTGFGAELAKLREDVGGLGSADEIARWIGECMQIGIDPL
jgi:hypothetical protein